MAPLRMAPLRAVGVTVICVVLSLGLQGCGLSNICNHSIPFTCKFAEVGTGGCTDTTGASITTAKDVGECRSKCASTQGCKYYSFCSDPSNCATLYKGACGTIVNDNCELATSLHRDDLTTWQMWDAKMHAPASQQPMQHMGIGFVLGLLTAGGVAMMWVRLGRRSAMNRDMELIESGPEE